jgi:hypothetical protein
VHIGESAAFWYQTHSRWVFRLVAQSVAQSVPITPRAGPNGKTGLSGRKPARLGLAAAKIEELNALWGKIYERLALEPVPGQEVLRVAATIRLGDEAGVGGIVQEASGLSVKKPSQVTK